MKRRQSIVAVTMTIWVISRMMLVLAHCVGDPTVRTVLFPFPFSTNHVRACHCFVHYNALYIGYSGVDCDKCCSVAPARRNSPYSVRERVEAIRREVQ